MPKVRSQRSISRAHITSVKPVNRPFAIQDNAVQHLDVGALKDVSADEILRSVNADASRTEHASNTNKKERRILKHELFIERLEASRAPYSKSHARRLKRKEREQLAGGLGSLKAALPSITVPTAVSTSATPAGEAGAAAAPARVHVVAITTATAAGGGTSAKLAGSTSSDDDDRKKTHGEEDASQTAAAAAAAVRPRQIGKGKGAPLTRSQRRRALMTECFRQPLIRSNPEFAANPFETIRTHARNTLAPHQP